MKSIRTLTMAVMMLAASSSMAQERLDQRGRLQDLDRVSVDMDMHGAEYNGTQKLRLRQLLKERNEWLRLRDFKLESVIVTAKSKAGQGTIKLVIDGRTIGQSNVAGRERDYYRNEARTYTAIQMRNYLNAQDPTWVLTTSGNIRILEIRFNLVEERGGSHPSPIGSRVVKIADGKFDKLIEDRDSYSVRVDNVREIRVVSTQGKFLVKEVELEFANGGSERIQFNTEVKRKRNLEIQLKNRDIRRVSIVGTSLDLIGSRAEYAIEAVVRERR